MDFKRRELTVRDAKNNEFRGVDMNEVLCEILKRHPHHIKSDLVICHSDEEGTAYTQLHRPFWTALIHRAGLPRIRLHDLRNLKRQAVETLVYRQEAQQGQMDEVRAS